MPDWSELRELCCSGSEAEICEWIANVPWEDHDQACAIASACGITENDVMRWIYLNLK